MTPWTTKPQLLHAALVPQGGQVFNGQAIAQGHLVLLARNGQHELEAWLDERGHLHLRAPDADRYELRADGHLVYHAGGPTAVDFVAADFTNDNDFQ